MKKTITLVTLLLSLFQTFGQVAYAKGCHFKVETAAEKINEEKTIEIVEEFSDFYPAGSHLDTNKGIVIDFTQDTLIYWAKTHVKSLPYIEAILVDPWTCKILNIYSAPLE